LYVVAAFTSVGILIALYPVVRVENSALAIGAVVFRAIEAVFYMVAVLCLLSLVVVGQKIVNVASDQQTAMRVVGGIFLNLLERAALLGVVSFCVGSFLYYWIFPITGYTILILQVAIQEMILTLWLIIRGFRGSERESDSTSSH
jgi:hypothetical protein